MTDPQATPVTSQPVRKPRIALMGEFSAGKSTLMNLLLGCDPMPVRITATRVPPVWVTHGPRGAVLLREDGSEERFEGADLTEAPMEGTDLIRFSMESDILKLCELIDIPGISDPNLNYETWLDVLEEVDCVLWCTHATQAWRQSEAALWEQISETVKGPNYLVVTQFDKLRSERDRARVLARLAAEATAEFEAIIPLATMDAINAGSDEEAWRASGGAALIERMVTMLVGVPQGGVPQAPSEKDLVNVSTLEPRDGEVDRSTLDAQVQPKMDHASCAGAIGEDGKKVVPRRVRPKSPNPERPSAAELQPYALQGFPGG
ncbi:dynamin family protein [Shimia sp. MMG029]|uniref:dynamin family protein n=1 Tax=Shimia sp. MMG029 TaxID=3021978 RepID=UPI0022FE0177|nr:dynamin family protein [Shimia sp. MMG029]MDA5558250.1 dynamin family protein [Shimia sp. MMG029]